MFKAAVRKYPVVMISKTTCPWCDRAKDLLDAVADNIDDCKGTKIFKVDKMKGGTEMKEYIVRKTAQSSVPNIFIGGHHIGGYDDIKKLHRKGQLRRKIKDAMREWLWESIEDVPALSKKLYLSADHVLWNGIKPWRGARKD